MAFWCRSLEIGEKIGDVGWTYFWMAYAVSKGFDREISGLSCEEK